MVVDKIAPTWKASQAIRKQPNLPMIATCCKMQMIVRELGELEDLT